MERENKTKRIIIAVIIALLALAVAVFALYRTEKHLRRMYYLVEKRLGLKKNAEFRVDFDEV